MDGGWLPQDEWDIDGTNDFEYEISNTPYLDVSNGWEAVKNMYELTILNGY